MEQNRGADEPTAISVIRVMIVNSGPEFGFLKRTFCTAQNYYFSAFPLPSYYGMAMMTTDDQKEVAVQGIRF